MARPRATSKEERRRPGGAFHGMRALERVRLSAFKQSQGAICQAKAATTVSYRTRVSFCASGVAEWLRPFGQDAGPSVLIPPGEGSRRARILAPRTRHGVGRPRASQHRRTWPDARARNSACGRAALSEWIWQHWCGGSHRAWSEGITPWRRADCARRSSSFPVALERAGGGYQSGHGCLRLICSVPVQAKPRREIEKAWAAPPLSPPALEAPIARKQ
jgi:hypothetical protein